MRSRKFITHTGQSRASRTNCFEDNSWTTLVVRSEFAHLFGVAGAQYDVVHYSNDEAACKERLAELGLKPFGAG